MPVRVHEALKQLQPLVQAGPPNTAAGYACCVILSMSLSLLENSGIGPRVRVQLNVFPLLLPMRQFSPAASALLR